MSTLKQQGTKAFFWDFAGKLANHGVGFIVSVILARLLEPSDFGLIAMAMVFIGIAGIFTDIGLGSALIQRRRILPIHYTSVFYFNIFSSLLLTVIMYFSAPYIAEFFHNDALIPIIDVIALTFVINAFSSVHRTILRRKLNYARLAKINFLAGLVGATVGISMAFASYGVWSLVVQSLVQGTMFNILIWIKSRWRPTLKFSWKALTQLWGYGFRMFMSGLLENIFTRLDTLIIGKLFEPAILGYFNRAKSLDRMIVKYSSGSLMSVLFPVLSKVQRDLSRFQYIFRKSYGIIIFIAFFLVGLFYLVSHELVLLLYGEKWLQTVDYFKILVLSSFAYPVSALLVNVLSSRGNSKAFLHLEIYKKIIGVINLAVAFHWGIKGYLYGFFLTMVLSVYLNILFVHKEISIPIRQMIKPILSQALLTFAAVVIVTWINQNITFSLAMRLVLESVEFSVLYLLMNFYIGTEASLHSIPEIRNLFNKFIGRVKR